MDLKSLIARLRTQLDELKAHAEGGTPGLKAAVADLDATHADLAAHAETSGGAPMSQPSQPEPATSLTVGDAEKD